MSEIEYTADPFVNCGLEHFNPRCGWGPFEQKENSISAQITNHRVLLLLSGASLEEKSPVTFGSVGIPSIVYGNSTHIAQRAHRERGSLHCASDCWLLYLVVTHAAERAWMLPVNMWSHVCMCIIRAAAAHTTQRSIMAGDEKLKIKRRSTAAAAAGRCEWESWAAAWERERETERIRSCFTWGYWVTFPSFVTITYANHNQCTINNSSIKLLLYFLAQTRAPLQFRPAVMRCILCHHLCIY